MHGLRPLRSPRASCNRTRRHPCREARRLPRSVNHSPPCLSNTRSFGPFRRCAPHWSNSGLDLAAMRDPPAGSSRPDIHRGSGAPGMIISVNPWRRFSPSNRISRTSRIDRRAGPGCRTVGERTVLVARSLSCLLVSPRRGGRPSRQRRLAGRATGPTLAGFPPEAAGFADPPVTALPFLSACLSQ